MYRVSEGLARLLLAYAKRFESAWRGCADLRRRGRRRDKDVQRALLRYVHEMTGRPNLSLVHKLLSDTTFVTLDSLKKLRQRSTGRGDSRLIYDSLIQVGLALASSPGALHTSSTLQ